MLQIFQDVSSSGLRSREAKRPKTQYSRRNKPTNNPPRTLDMYNVKN